MKYQNLHCHTTVSDGKLDYLASLKVCEDNRIGVIAFTDHDSLPKEEEINKLRKVESKTQWIVGVEMSSDMPHELKHFGGDLHIVGLFVDPLNPSLRDHCRKAKASRIERMQRMVKRLTELGFNITEADCLQASSGEAVGRPHILAALKAKPENLRVIDNLRRKMEEGARHNPLVFEKYQEMLKKGEDEYPYTLFFSDDSYIPGVYVHYLYKKDLDESVALIRGAGGLAFLAHWFTDKHKVDEGLIEKLFKENRLDGVETVYGLGALGQEELRAQRKILRPLVGRYNKLESGGSDAHSQEALEEFAKTGWYAKLTFRLIETIMENSKVDTSWSSLSKS